MKNAFLKSRFLRFQPLRGAFVLAIILLISNLNAQSIYEPRGVGGGGALSGFSISPYSDLWFVGTDMGTLYRSSDAGAHWRAVSHFETRFSGDLPNAAYLGFNADTNLVFHTYEGCIPQMSMDGGLTWDTLHGLLNLLPTGGYEFADCKDNGNSTRVRYWISDSFDPDLCFAASGDGMFRSTDKGNSWARIPGLHGNSRGTFIDHSTMPRTIYHANTDTIFLSTDGGATFSTYHVDALRWFAGGRDNSGLTLAYIEANDSACLGIYNNRHGQSNLDCGYVRISRNGGPFSTTNQIGGDWIRMAENDAQRIWVTGARVWHESYGTQVWLSEDAGQNWEQRFQQLLTATNPWKPWPDSLFDRSAVGLDVGYDDAGYRSFSVNRRNAAIGGGTGNYFLHTSENAGNYWLSPFTEFADTGARGPRKKWRTTGLDPTSAWLLEFHPNNDQVAYVGYSDIGGKVTEDGGQTWRLIQAVYNTTYDYAFDPADDSLVYAAVSSLHDFPYSFWGNYNLTQPGGIWKSGDRGRNWVRMTPAGGDWDMPFQTVAYDAANDRFYGGTKGRGVTRSTDGGATWEWFNQGLPTWPKIVSQIEIDLANQDLYLLLTSDKPDYSDISKTGIWHLPFGDSVWVQLRDSVHPPGIDGVNFLGPLWKYPVYFAIDWNDPTRQKIWMTDNQIPGMYKASGLWFTDDRGQNWHRKLEFRHPQRITLDPCDSNLVFVNGLGGPTDGGPQYSTDYGQTWQKNTDLPLQNNLNSLTVDPNDPTKVFYLAFGGGMWYGDKPGNGQPCLSTAISPVEVEGNALIVWPVPSEDELFFKFAGGNLGQFGTAELLDIQGRVVRQFRFASDEAVHHLSIPTTATPGMYLLRVQVGENLQVKKVLLR
ncbi:MAG: T9SS type A sorting domain-containing protein [Bacteroidota bacterium]